MQVFRLYPLWDVLSGACFWGAELLGRSDEDCGGTYSILARDILTAAKLSNAKVPETDAALLQTQIGPMSTHTCEAISVRLPAVDEEMDTNQWLVWFSHFSKQIMLNPSRFRSISIKLSGFHEVLNIILSLSMFLWCQHVRKGFFTQDLRSRSAEEQVHWGELAGEKTLLIRSAGR